MPLFAAVWRCLPPTASSPLHLVSLVLPHPAPCPAVGVCGGCPHARAPAPAGRRPRRLPRLLLLPQAARGPGVSAGWPGVCLCAWSWLRWGNSSAALRRKRPAYAGEPRWPRAHLPPASPEPLRRERCTHPPGARLAPRPPAATCAPPASPSSARSCPPAPPAAPSLAPASASSEAAAAAVPGGRQAAARQRRCACGSSGPGMLACTCSDSHFTSQTTSTEPVDGARKGLMGLLNADIHRQRLRSARGERPHRLDLV